MKMRLDESGVKAAKAWAIEEACDDGVSVNEYIDGIIRAYLSALPSSPVSELTDEMVEAGAKAIAKAWGEDWECCCTERKGLDCDCGDAMTDDRYDSFDDRLSRDDCRTAARATLTTLSTRNAELEREVKRLREAVASVVDVSKAGHDTVSFLVELRRVSLLCAAALSTSPQGGEHE